MTTTTLERTGNRSIGTHRLLVTQRDPSVPAYRPLGFLSLHSDGTFRFAYLRSAVDASWFAPLPGLSRTEGAYTSPRLFPLFAERVISPRRPDRPATMKALDLSTDATPFEVLTRSGGRRVEDHIELTPVGVSTDVGAIAFDFLVHGVLYTTAEAQDRITALRTGDSLAIQHDPANTYNTMARLVIDDQLRLGYVPDPLVSVVHRMTDVGVTVLMANGPEVGFHMRLLVRLTGRLDGPPPFTGTEWETVGPV